MRRVALFVALAGLFASPAFAQSTYPTAQGGRVAGVVPLTCNVNGANCAPVQQGTGTTAQQVQGVEANGATVASNPIGVGGVVNPASLPSLTAGQRGDFMLDVYRNLRVQPSLFLTGGIDAFPNASMGWSLGANGSGSGDRVLFPIASMVFNGTSWDRQRGDTSGTYVVEVPSAAAAAGVTTVASAAVSGGQVIKASAGNLYGFNVVSGASAGYVMVFNSTTVPADGAVTPTRCIPLAANTGIDINLRGQPTRFSTGIAIVFSTTGCYTKTASATAFIAGDAQ